MGKLQIDLADLQGFFEDDSEDISAYLDSETGEIFSYENYHENTLEELLTNEDTLESVLATIKSAPYLGTTERVVLVNVAKVHQDKSNRYRLIPKRDSRDTYQDMQEFAFALKDAQTRERLMSALQGKGAFRRFKDALLDYPNIRDRWLDFESTRARLRIEDWLESEDIEADLE